MHIRMFYSGPFCRFWCVILSFAMALGPSLAAKAQERPTRSVESPTVPARRLSERERASGDTTLLAAPHAGKIDLRYVTPKAVAIAAVRPRQILTAPNAEMLPVEVVTAAGLVHLGLDPADVVEIVAFVEPPSSDSLQYGAAIKFAKPFAGSSIPERLRAHTQPAELAGRRYLQSGHPLLPSLYMPDGQTLLVMPDSTLRRVLAAEAGGPASAFLQRVSEVAAAHDLYATVDVATLRPLISPMINMAVMQQGERFPPEAQPFLAVPNLVSDVELTVNLLNPGPTSCIVHANDEASADQLEALVEVALEIRRQAMAAEFARLEQSEDPIERAWGQYMQRMSEHSAQSFRPERKDDSLVLFQTTGGGDSAQQQLIMVAVVGVLVALLLPAIQAAREAARRNQSMNNLKQLMLSFHNYADAHRTFPAHASYDADGKPLLSWRVHVLPFLDEGALYRQFHLDEPWDSPHNKALIPLMPEVFQNPNLDLEPGKTNYLAVVGKECVFDGSERGMSFARITDGTSKTIMLVEADADQAVEWTKPDDLEYDANNPAAGLGHVRPGGCLAAFADGHISPVSNETDQKTLKALFTRAGGEGVDLP